MNVVTNRFPIPYHASAGARPKCQPAFPRAGRGAFSLVEVTLALGVVAFCLAALVGMVPVGLRSERASIDQMRATQLLNDIKNDVTAITEPYSNPNNPGDPKNGTLLSKTIRFQIPLNTPGGAGANPVYGNFLVDQSLALLSTTSAMPAAGNAVVAATSTTPAYAVHYDYSQVTSSYQSYQIRVLAAWPGSAQFSGTGTSLKLAGALGQVETLVTVSRL